MNRNFKFRYVYICYIAVSIVLYSQIVHCFRVLQPGAKQPDGSYPKPYEKGFVGYHGDPSNFQRERINEGAFETPTQELIYEGVSPRQSCPGMVGPFSDGNYYCSAQEFGYCDRRSGTCFCNFGYQGIDCTDCQDSHFKIGTACYPKILCPNDCNDAGTCNYYNGICTCYPHRIGTQCEILLCSSHSPLCETCTESECRACSPGYYLTLDSRVCGSCYDFDPRCAGCTKEEGCTVCADSTLTSVLRSGYRSSDPKLPKEEDTREFSLTLPFGTKSPDSFAAAENYLVVATPNTALNKYAVSCSQGLSNDSTIICSPYEESHIVCGHYGVFTFTYPNYVVTETSKFIRITVERTGGGYGNVSVNYIIKHITTNDSDVVATAQYTTSQTLVFSAGIVQVSFLIDILDDNIVEANEVFQVLLETPEGGGSVGAQFRANVTIIDDDSKHFSPKLSKTVENTTQSIAGRPFSVHVHAVAGNGNPIRTGGEKFLAVIENYANFLSNNASVYRNTLRQSYHSLVDSGNGTYTINFSGVKEQGVYQLRVFYAFPNGLMGNYYYDAFFQRLAVPRIDRVVNFTWGTGRLIPRGSDYISIRWTGAVLSPQTGNYQFYVEADDHARLWINGVLLLDHWNERLANLDPPRKIALVGGILNEIQLEYREVVGNAYIRLMWSYAPTSGHNAGIYSNLTVITPNYLYSLYEVDRSPIVVKITSATMNPRSSECTGNGLFTGTVLQTGQWTICPRDMYGNLLDDSDITYLSTHIYYSNLTLLQPYGDHLGVGSNILNPTITFNPTTFCYDAYYTPEIAGIYLMHIFYQNRSNNNLSDVAGSPYIVDIVSARTNGPKSTIIGLNAHKTLHLVAGTCQNFTIVARDSHSNLRLVGGDNFEVYIFRVNQFNTYSGNPFPAADVLSFYPKKVSSLSPSLSPTASPNIATDYPPLNLTGPSPPSDSGQDVIRFGTVADFGNGNYSVSFCPVISGVYEIHILLNSDGVSNQPYQLMQHQASLDRLQGMGSYTGQYVDQSPYPLVVTHSTASIITSTAEGDGLVHSEVGVPASFILTVRDAWDNLLFDEVFAPTISVQLVRSPNAQVSIWNYYNGSYNIEYISLKSSINYITVRINGFQILNSPFILNIFDGAVSANFSYATGPGLYSATAGVAAYFQVYAYDLNGNRKTDYNEVFEFTISGSNNITGFCQPCPSPPIQDHPICSPTDPLAGHYFCTYTPIYAGPFTATVYLITNDTATSIATGRRMTSVGLVKTAIKNSPTHGNVFPPSTADTILTGLSAVNTNVSGTLYDNTAGVDGFIYLQLRDYYGNKVVTGGAILELALLGVGVQWGVVLPIGRFEQGLPNEYYYKGFYNGYPNYYGTMTDNNDGTYNIKYNAPLAGQYVMRLALAEPGLNATFYNTTDFGYLVDDNFDESTYRQTALGKPINVDSTSISWTGDIRGIPGPRASLGQSTYYDKFLSISVSNVSYNASKEITNKEIVALINLSPSASDQVKSTASYNYRNEYLSIRWTGMITPKFPELYKFSFVMDADCFVRLYIGGVGLEFNGSASADPPGKIIDTRLNPTVAYGYYNFTNYKYREIAVEYAHYTGDPYVQLYWESPSTTKSVVPLSAFTHWNNISHYNTTIHPAALCSSCSTAVGKALTNAQVAVMKSFTVYARDQYGNLLQRGGEPLQMVAVGADGVSFRGTVVDYSNSTYLVEYYPTKAGVFRMFVSIGCCPPSPDVGLPTELQRIAPLLIQGSPFILTVVPVMIDPSRSVAIGQGLSGGIVGQDTLSFTVQFRDVFSNPTTLDFTTLPPITPLEVYLNYTATTSLEPIITFTDLNNDLWIPPYSTLYDLTPFGFSFSYNMTKASSYNLRIQLNITTVYATNRTPSAYPVIVTVSNVGDILGSPFNVTWIATWADPSKAIARGLGLRQATIQANDSLHHRNNVSMFDIQLFDQFENPLTSGGDKFFIRLQGDAAFSMKDESVVPLCLDQQNGFYSCNYTPLHGGVHQLVIKLLNAMSHQSEGGSGLVGRYFNTISNIYNPFDASFTTPSLTRLDPFINFFWSNGFIVPTSSLVEGSDQSIQFITWTETFNFTFNTGNYIPAGAAGQSIRWDGYIVAPVTDVFTIRAVTSIVNVTIYIDAVMVYDSYYGISRPMQLVYDAAYNVVILLELDPIGMLSTNDFNSTSQELQFDLVWSTPTVKEYTIPSYLLYDAATDIALSPFPVTVFSV